MIDFPITELLNDELSLQWLEQDLYPAGLCCPHCQSQQCRIARTNKQYHSYRCLACDG